MKPTRYEPRLPVADDAETAAAPFRGDSETDLDRLKNRLLRERIVASDQPKLYAAIRRAATEAAGIAWLTPYPLLLFPTLFLEKSDEARRRTVRQHYVRERTRELMPPKTGRVTSRLPRHG